MKVAVLGLGPSIDLFLTEEPHKFDLTIGVNDIWRYVQTDIVVCVDTKNRFTRERLAFIETCTPREFISIFPTTENPEITDWSDHSNYRKIELLPYLADHVCQLNLKQYPKSMCSPFIATAVAFKDYGAKEIHLFGVDLLSHPNLDRGMCDRIKGHFKNMLIALRQNGSDLRIHGNGILSNFR